MIGIINVLAALGQQTRLEVLTLLSRGPAGGQTSGDLAIQARVPANSMSTHLSILAAAGLVSSTRSGRKVVYRIEREAIENALGILSARLDNPKPIHFSGAPSWKVASYVADLNSGSRRAFGFGGSDLWPCSAILGGVTGNPSGHDHDDAPCRGAVQVLRPSTRGTL